MPAPVPAAAFLKKPALPQAPVYAVFGPEAWLRRRCLDALCAVLTETGLEIRRVQAGDSIAPLLDELRSPSLFGGAFAAVLRNERQGPRHEESTRFKEELLAYLERPGRRNVLVFDGATWQRNLAVPKRVCENFPSVICEELKSWETAAWDGFAALAAADHGLKLDAGALAALRAHSGQNLGRAAQELAKLALLCPSGAVSANDIARACGYEGQDRTFPLCDAVLTGDTRAALAHAAALASKAEVSTLLPLLALLRNQILALGRAARALAEGADGADAVAASRHRLREQLKGRFVRTARGLNTRRVALAVDVLMTADEELKSQSPDPGVLLVAVVSRLCETLHSART
ncbi:MAG: DNA polymerase III subunit delta [Planctomycetes bacterium]|jgi:DNA polymerase III delta subunit|nr:DNA polymerase III subunit delta [Planctomycetota bacterium]